GDPYSCMSTIDFDRLRRFLRSQLKKSKVFLLLARLWLRKNETAPRIPEQAVRPRQRKEREDSP
ncbi:hypothetical protein, partial [Sutterella wadsworthensis]|uniref:hypothetical protein n=1 Tax=Sutterella wadsworthensis TaxID=40545 RepID=UPI003A92AC3A